MFARFGRELKRAGVVENERQVVRREGGEGQDARVAQGGAHVRSRAARIGACTVKEV